jgi:hypothetical protein
MKRMKILSILEMKTELYEFHCTYFMCKITNSEDELLRIAQFKHLQNETRYRH